MPFADAEARKHYHRDYMRAYYRRRKHEEQTLLKRKSSFSTQRSLPMPSRPRPEVCELCGSKPQGRYSLSLDHCHSSGRFRGWLCNKCNTAIGRAGDCADAVETWAMKAVAYLRLAESN